MWFVAILVSFVSLTSGHDVKVRVLGATRRNSERARSDFFPLCNSQYCCGLGQCRASILESLSTISDARHSDPRILCNLSRIVIIIDYFVCTLALYRDSNYLNLTRNSAHRPSPCPEGKAEIHSKKVGRRPRLHSLCSATGSRHGSDSKHQKRNLEQQLPLGGPIRTLFSALFCALH